MGFIPFTYPRLYAVTEVPKHLAFNTYIRHGYRSRFTFSECVASLFYFHNETLNIYSHGLMALYLCLGLPFYLTTSSSQLNILSVLNFLACIAPFTLSSVYHLFMCHHNGPCLYDQLLTADLVGIAAVNCFGFFVPMWVTFACHPVLRSAFIMTYVLVSVTILYFFVIAKTATQRSMPLLGFFVVRLLVLMVRMLYLGNTNCGDASAWRYYIAMDVTAFIGALINVTRVPERWFPGKLDYVLNSHQLMHLFAMVGIWCLNEATHRDLNWLILDDHQSCATDINRM